MASIFKMFVIVFHYLNYLYIFSKNQQKSIYFWRFDSFSLFPCARSGPLWHHYGLIAKSTLFLRGLLQHYRPSFLHIALYRSFDFFFKDSSLL